MRLQGIGDLRVISGNTNDDRARFPQMRIGRATRIEGAQHVDIDDGLKGVRGHANRGRGEIACGDAEQKIDLAELLAGLIKRGFHVGDLVVNAGGQQLRIDSIDGDTAIVRYGVGNYNVYKAKLSELMSAKAAAAKTEGENEQKIIRAGFEDHKNHT